MSNGRVKYPFKINAWVDEATMSRVDTLLRHPHAVAHGINASDVVRECLRRGLDVIRGDWDAVDERTVA